MSKKNPLIKAPEKPAKPSPKDLAVTWMKNGCCWFTVLCIGMLLLNLVVWNTNGVSPVSYLLLLPLALCLAGAGSVRRSGMSRGTRYALHPLLTVGGTYFFGLMPYQIRSHAQASTVLVLVIALLAVYGIGVGVASLILRRINVKKDAEMPYQSMFERNR